MGSELLLLGEIFLFCAGDVTYQKRMLRHGGPHGAVLRKRFEELGGGYELCV
jgi:hypothetical protein